MELADSQGRSLEECKRAVGSREFLSWKVFREHQINAFQRQDYFLAQIALHICRGQAKNPRSLKLEQFLLKFVNGKPPEEDPEEETEEARTTRIAASKAFWKGLAGKLRLKPKNLAKKDSENVDNLSVRTGATGSPPHG